jgi:hypothetical protein
VDAWELSVSMKLRFAHGNSAVEILLDGAHGMQ